MVIISTDGFNLADSVICLKTGHEIICNSVDKQNLGAEMVMSVYHWSLKKNGEIIFSFSTNSTELYEIWQNIEGFLTETETGACVQYIRSQLCPSENEIPPWERTKPTHKYHRDPEDAYFSLNDDGNATRIYQEAAGYLVFEQNQRVWYAWIENHWELAKERVGRVARFIGLSLLDELK